MFVDLFSKMGRVMCVFDGPCVFFELCVVFLKSSSLVYNFVLSYVILYTVLMFVIIIIIRNCTMCLVFGGVCSDERYN